MVGDQREIRRTAARKEKEELRKIAEDRAPAIEAVRQERLAQLKRVKEARKARRTIRSAAYLRNVERYGKERAGFISVAITHKRKGTYRYTDDDVKKMVEY